jgi:large subunit ribosomal protein L30
VSKPRKLAVTLVKSPIGNRPAARATVASLGLRRLHQTVTLPDNEAVRGMISAVRHLVSWREITDEIVTTPSPRPPTITIMHAAEAGGATTEGSTAPTLEQTPRTEPETQHATVSTGEQVEDSVQEASV